MARSVHVRQARQAMTFTVLQRAIAIVRALAPPLALFMLALVIRLALARLASFPISEDGAYYLTVARRLVEGQGLTTQTLWSYSTPPLALPRPAFEIWMPMSSLVSALAMVVFGTGFDAAQIGHAVLGATIAPLAWLVARDACQTLRVPQDRWSAVSVASGALVGIVSFFALSSADPDSTTPFLVFGTASALLLKATLSSQRATVRVGLGLVLGLAYLSRQEAIWIGLTCLILAWISLKTRYAGSGSLEIKDLMGWLMPVILGGLLVVGPWLLRQWFSFGTALPGQALENALHIKGEDIFAWLDRPSLQRYVAIGLPSMLEGRASAIAHQFLFVVATLGFPIGVTGVIGCFALRDRLLVGHSIPLLVLLLSGAITFFVTAILFPVATLWGTFRHSAGPGLVGLTIISIIWVDGLLVRYARWRDWRGDAKWTGFAMLGSLAIIFCVIQGIAWRDGAAANERQVTVVASILRDGEDRASQERKPIISDRVMWLGLYLDTPLIALPDEPLANVVDLAKRFGSDTMVVLNTRGRYPGELLTRPLDPCLAEEPRHVGPPDISGWIVHLNLACTQ